ncbi:hypothetical protein C1877_11780 [Gordonibacter pamelaeae]|uniref:Uncharacterized protein n=1 Tax=Gordonibacter pamelaeae TaxID=471189 RepID=A0A369LY38_9ACTN|nr:hypothetical protein C1877_11780 [Gordonibacter pamelaeae]
MPRPCRTAAPVRAFRPPVPLHPADAPAPPARRIGDRAGSAGERAATVRAHRLDGFIYEAVKTIIPNTLRK